MTPERAQEILDTMGPFGAMEYTEQERLEVLAVWRTMPGSTCFYDALVRITREGRGFHLESTGPDRFRLHHQPQEAR